MSLHTALAPDLTRGTAKQVDAGLSLPLIITAGDTWLIIAPCCCNRDRHGFQAVWEERWLPEKMDAVERGFTNEAFAAVDS